MTNRFNKFIPFILKHETVFKKGHYGDYTYAIAENDPDDPGGVTKFGIDLGEHKEKPWRMTADQIRNLNVEGAIQLYWRHWCLNKIELLPEKIGESYFNVATMSGRGQADLCLKRTHTAEEYNLDYLRVLGLILAHRPASKKFISGWKARIYDLAKFLDINILT